MDPGMKRYGRIRGVALWGNLVISPTGKDGRVIATDRETGKIVWDKNLSDHPELELSAAPLALKDDIIIGGSGGDQGTRNWIASLDPKTGDLKWKTYTIPAPRTRQRNLKDQNEAWKTGGGAFYVTGSYDPQTNLTIWGSGNPVPGYDATRRPGDNLFTASAIAFDVANGKMKWYFQYTPNDSRDYDETGTHVLIDTKVNGQDRKIVTHAGRNGFNYTFDRTTGRFLNVGQYVAKVTWTKGIDPKTGKPVDYDPTKSCSCMQSRPAFCKTARDSCPEISGGGTVAGRSPKTKLFYIPSLEGAEVTPTSAHVPKAAGGTYTHPDRITSSPVCSLGHRTTEGKDLPYPNTAGAPPRPAAVVTALVDGTVLAFDDQTLEELWRINVGTGFNAPPMTYSVNGKQYIAIASGLGRSAKNKLTRSTEMRNFSNATMIFVFGL
jgi:alcohol dehydrogenase (cytochrome c)